jgi:hypothetical protein
LSSQTWGLRCTMPMVRGYNCSFPPIYSRLKYFVVLMLACAMKQIQNKKNFSTKIHNLRHMYLHNYSNYLALNFSVYPLLGSPAYPSSGTTNLHLDISSAVNVMVRRLLTIWFTFNIRVVSLILIKCT